RRAGRFRPRARRFRGDRRPRFAPRLSSSARLPYALHSTRYAAQTGKRRAMRSADRTDILPPHDDQLETVMNLLIIRHATAQDKGEWAKSGRSDDERPLTGEGRRKMAQTAKGLRNVVDQIDVLATSPLVRARQTAEIVAEEFDDLVLKTTKALVP